MECGIQKEKGGFTVKCLACQNDRMIDATTTYFVNLQDCYVIIENVPCKKCTQCGEEVFSMGVFPG